MDKDELETKVKNLRDNNKNVYAMVSEAIRGHTSIEVSNRLMLTPTEATNSLEYLRKEELLKIYGGKYITSENVSSLEMLDNMKTHKQEKWSPKGKGTGKKMYIKKDPLTLKERAVMDEIGGMDKITPEELKEMNETSFERNILEPEPVHGPEPERQEYVRPKRKYKIKD